jgi:hypothetical protein
MTMADFSAQPGNPSDKQPEISFERVNEALLACSDRDWNYSRITLVPRVLDRLDSPYVLRLETLDLTSNQGRSDLKTLINEVKWGERHSSELGVLELVSLRINKALLEASSDEYWRWKRPVVRIVKKETLVEQGVTSTLWYEVREVAGDHFDNR